jgi:flavin reductase (DIM6/NTAB) family NADH-FMN oxidoreductase RutF
MGGPPGRDKAAERARFRSVMATFATGVTVVTSMGADGPAGMTANAVASLSLDPLLVMVGFDLTSRTLTAVRLSRRFAVNVLASDQDGVSDLFASKRPEAEKFAECAHVDTSGVPILLGTLAWLRCEATAVHPGGDHVIVVGKIDEMGGNGGEPLLFFGGRYRMLDPARVPGRGPTGAQARSQSASGRWRPQAGTARQPARYQPS